MKKIVIIMLICIASACNSRAAETPQEKMVFAGAGTNLPIMRLLAKEFKKSRPDVSIEVPDSIGSTGGIKAAHEDMNMMLVSTPQALGITDTGAVMTEDLKIKILKANGYMQGE